MTLAILAPSQGIYYTIYSHTAVKLFVYTAVGAFKSLRIRLRSFAAKLQRYNTMTFACDGVGPPVLGGETYTMKRTVGKIDAHCKTIIYRVLLHGVIEMVFLIPIRGETRSRGLIKRGGGAGIYNNAYYHTHSRYNDMHVSGSFINFHCNSSWPL